MARRPAPDTAAWLLFISGLTLSFLLSAQALGHIGIPYDAPYGPMVAKLHPGSYLLMLAWVLALARHGNPLSVAVHAAREQALASIYLVCMLLVFAWVVMRHGTSGAAYIVQTLWLPGLAVLTLPLLAPRRQRQTLQWLMLLLCANALLALAEAFGKFHLIPLPAEQEGVQFFRASAFLGHPLSNANITVALLPALVLMRWPAALRVAAVVLVLVSLLAFGARTALGVGLAVYGAQLLVTLARRALRGHYTYRQLTGGSAALMLGSAALVLTVMATGLGDRIFNSLKWDNSASVRLRAWEAFDHLRGDDWLLGLPPVRIDQIAVAIGLDPRYEAIENFWVYAYLQFGLIGFVPFVAGLACLIALMTWRAAPALKTAVPVFFLVASTANTLSSKTVSLTLLAVTLMASAPVVQRRRPLVPKPKGRAWVRTAWAATKWSATQPMPYPHPESGHKPR